LLCDNTCPVECERDKTYNCDGECIPFNRPCHNKCLRDLKSGATKLFIGCDKVCKTTEDGDSTWLCGNECQSLSIPCESKCPGNYRLNCDNKCEKYLTYYACGDYCIPRGSPCNSSCLDGNKFCNGNCQKSYFQCNGKCLDQNYPVPTCNGTCSVSDDELWMCNGTCSSTSEPCRGNCHLGNFYVCIVVRRKVIYYLVQYNILMNGIL
jgi:hypothetical protein